MKTTIRVHAEIELTITLSQYDEAKWTIVDLKKDARLAAVRKLAEMFDKEPSVRIIGDLKLRAVATEAEVMK